MKKSTKRKSRKPTRAQRMLDTTYPGLHAPPPTAAETLTERQSTHGDFSENARVMQGVKRVLRTGKNWRDYLSHGEPIGPSTLTYVQAEAIEMIVVKLGRIVTGDPNHKDSWLDIEGYARLARERLA